MGAQAETEFLVAGAAGRYDIRARQIGGDDRPLVLYAHGFGGRGTDKRWQVLKSLICDRDLFPFALASFDFVSKRKGELNYSDCRLDDWLGSYAAVVRHFKSKTSQPILAIGHSLGGLVVSRSSSHDAAFLLEPTAGRAWPAGSPLTDNLQHPADEEGDTWVVGSGSHAITVKREFLSDFQGVTLAPTTKSPFYVFVGSESPYADAIVTQANEFGYGVTGIGFAGHSMSVVVPGVGGDEGEHALFTALLFLSTHDRLEHRDITRATLSDAIGF